MKISKSVFSELYGISNLVCPNWKKSIPHKISKVCEEFFIIFQSFSFESHLKSLNLLLRFIYDRAYSNQFFFLPSKVFFRSEDHFTNVHNIKHQQHNKQKASEHFSPCSNLMCEITLLSLFTLIAQRKWTKGVRIVWELPVPRSV